MIDTFIKDLSISQAALIGIGLYIVGIVVHRFLYYSYFSPYVLIPGPPRESFITGNFRELLGNDKPAVTLPFYRYKWGKVFRWPAFWGHERLCITDPAALNHILMTHGYWYYKTPEIRHELGMVLGKGILWTEGDDHRRQKRLLAPAFSQATVDTMVPLFYDEANKMKDYWEKEIDNSPDKKSVSMDVSEWLARLTLDVIGLAGFGYAFNSLENSDNKLAAAFHALLKTQRAPNHKSEAINFLVNKYKIIDYLPFKQVRDVKESLRVMREESIKIIEEKESGRKDQFEKNLITLLMKANSAADAKSKMTREEVMCQISTFMIAGSETSSTALTWAIYYMSINQECQRKLREEVRAALKKDQEEGSSSFNPDNINNMEYLDAFVKETLRLMPPVPATIREAQKDDVLPLTEPMKLTNGQEITELPIRKGTVIQINMGQLAFDKTAWGEDANDFVPGRWLKPLPDTVLKATAGGFTAYSHMLTFIGGARACIGYRMSIAEVKATLAVIAANFQFDPEPGVEILSRFMIVARPYVKGEENERSRLPIIVSRAK